VITGIGHEVDHSIADEVAHTAAKTPTAAAAQVVALVGEAADRVEELAMAAVRGAEVRLRSAEQRIERLARRGGDRARTVLLERDGHELLYFPLLGYSHGDFGAMQAMLERPGTVLGLGDGGAHCGLLCDASLPTYMLTHWVRDRDRGERFDLERAVAMQTSETAALYGFADRGVLAPGYRADVNVIDFDALRLAPPEMVHDLPAGGRRLVQRVTGYDATICAGVPVRVADEGTGDRPGRLVRGTRPAPR
jgi:N-acyl-D-aspartate/D-glutamate deacylase